MDEMRELAAAELVGVVQREASVRAASHARAVEAITELRSRECMNAQEASPGVETLPVEAVVESELAAALRVGPWHAGQLVRVAAALAERMHATTALLRAGAISCDRVETIARYAVPLADHVYAEALKQGLSPRAAEAAAHDMVARLEAMLLPQAGKLTPGQVRARTEKAVATLAPTTPTRGAAPPRAAGTCSHRGSRRPPRTVRTCVTCSPTCRPPKRRPRGTP